MKTTSPFYRTGVIKSPLHQNKLKEAKDRLKWEKENAKGYRKAGRKAVKLYEAGGEDDYPRSEFRANKAEDRGIIQSARETVREERRNLRQSKKNLRKQKNN
mgnify:CR=1 FL=1|tara:strand:- start:2704 stop:3009 length:306 start_codon:yes stop_codon:yes gene_type:complete